MTMLLLLLLLLSLSRACLQTLRFPGWENKSNILLSWKSYYFWLRAYSFSSMTNQAVIAFDDRRTHSNPVTSRGQMISRLGRHLGLATWHKYPPSVYACFSWPPGASRLKRAVKLLLEVEKIFLLFAVLLSFVDLFAFEALTLGFLNIGTAIFSRKFEGQ